MKQLILVFFLLTAFIAKSQTNIISNSDFDNIKINNIALTDIKKTLGKQAKVESLLGATVSFEDNGFYYYFKFNGLKLDFSTSGRKPYIESLDVLSNEATFTIKGITITVGDPISKLGEVALTTGRNGSKSILYAECDSCDVFININFDQTTKKITKINYFDMS
ncbi:hypothetical protein MHM83_02735 [Tenacibaculum sp. Mcav3-52]|uniref:Outer membrane lipoprotein carrier protein LolA n=1 Tax=Tenacibaculum mesophilum TaxID=104268 RepID=A0AAE9MPA0_9FLAO|nr:MULTISPECIES: hypothetical protein [Tenacibaculum]GFD76938.1 hypothetical protein KUL113_63580 [Tenacibaculum sp. KUL113]AZJ33001.1 hypothetical protein D6200_10725 [Tenacibaculum mesophilum]KAF9659200.1 hypothetical protein HBA12_02850 [Tenacibaculum mesophilum]MCG7500777.1 hypothetical protein [Tenacibaculum sp. Mcav3-52]QFS28251.1 hypothetical protein F9Y86_07550 [Tenacibaculum mesophilum]